MHIVHEKIEAIEKQGPCFGGLLLKFNPENRALKSRGNPQMKSRGLVLRASFEGFTLTLH
jgi:hypothetical protein